MKGLGGTGKLTDTIIDRLQNYYGLAIRNNVGNLENMRKATLAALFHLASSSDHSYHDHCPDGAKSWCQYKADMANNTTLYKPGPGLPKIVIYHVKPIFADLSDPALLEKCLHGKTQNQNESFNAMIWNRIPKEIRVNASTFEFGVFDAVSHFNLGNIATLNTFDEMGIDQGFYTIRGCYVENKNRVDNSVRKSSSEYKQRRKMFTW